MMFAAGITDLDPVGTSVIATVVVGVGTLFTLLVNALLKLASQSDEINRRATLDKQVVIDELRVELKAANDRGDFWFGKFDDCRAGRPIDDSHLPGTTTETP